MLDSLAQKTPSEKNDTAQNKQYAEGFRLGEALRTADEKLATKVLEKCGCSAEKPPFKPFKS